MQDRGPRWVNDHERERGEGGISSVKTRQDEDITKNRHGSFFGV